jgi:tyrosyl-tRNA synthetase
MKLSEELVERGFIHQNTGESLGEVIDDEKRTVYHGIDPSADSAHAGNMVIWMLLRHLTNAGHKVIFLVGGGTGMIGDPKPDAERTLNDSETIGSNVEKIKQQAERLIGGDSKIEFVNNADWLKEQNLITFLRDIGKHFTVNELIKKEAIANRLESETGLSYTEFAYPLLQGFDYLTLFKEKGCTLQVGGSDQWGNIVAGVDLIRRKEQATAHAITVPLVVDKATGKKFGKSEGNAIWLDAEKTSPYQFYQFWLNTSDESAVDYLKIFTFLSLKEITDISLDFDQNPGERSAQKRLAYEVTKFVHGEEATESVKKVSEIIFSGGDTVALSTNEKEILLTNAPTHEVKKEMMIVDILIATNLASSKREARTFIESGAITLGNEKVESIDETTELQKDNIITLRRGKKQYVVLYNK